MPKPKKNPKDRYIKSGMSLHPKLVRRVKKFQEATRRTNFSDICTQALEEFLDRQTKAS